MKQVLKGLQYRSKKLVNHVLPHYFASSPRLSSFYYFLLSNQFKREQHAVLNGKVKHLREQKSEQSNYYSLVRNTHRIEKGLLMRPRKPVFALDYIEQTTNAFLNLNGQYVEVAQYKWFKDVLSEYFEATKGHPKVDQLAQRFYSAIKDKETPQTPKKSVPYKRIASEKPDISYRSEEHTSELQ